MKTPVPKCIYTQTTFKEIVTRKCSKKISLSLNLNLKAHVWKKLNRDSLNRDLFAPILRDGILIDSEQSRHQSDRYDFKHVRSVSKWIYIGSFASIKQ